jgi:hypothetical protein
MINPEEAQRAVEAADRALDEDYSWIRDSALFERAYLIGVFAVLEALNTPDAKRSLPRDLMERYLRTMHRRDADDSLHGTVFGEWLEELWSRDPAAAYAPEAALGQLREILRRHFETGGRLVQWTLGELDEAEHGGVDVALASRLEPRLRELVELPWLRSPVHFPS